MEREQIIKALECCKTPLASDCENCSYTGKRLEDGVYEGCVNCLVGDALALIKEQEQRIKGQCKTAKKLRKQLKKANRGVRIFANRTKQLTEANENLHTTCTELERKCASLNEENERLRDELAKRPPKLVITKLPKKEGQNV